MKKKFFKFLVYSFNLRNLKKKKKISLNLGNGLYVDPRGNYVNYFNIFITYLMMKAHHKTCNT